MSQFTKKYSKNEQDAFYTELNYINC